jgi:SPP1 family predicted phage head-tail adaptor
MQAGALRHRIVIEQATETQNALGEPIETWLPLAVVWASREDVTGREAYAAQQISADVTTRFTCRYMPFITDGLTAKMRIVSDEVAYDIASIADPDGRRRTLVIMASRGA